jgi:hypothetical protein
VQLIADYPKNKRTLATIEVELNTTRKFVENPVAGTDRGDWEVLEKILELREAEYEMYCGMVRIGLGDLPEVERLVLQWWLIDRYDDDYIVDNAGIKNLEELKKIKKIALTKFTNIVMPN